jgi:hydroxymethylpyrimidine kinase/phosphomethylpyrimidine kinase
MLLQAPSPTLLLIGPLYPSGTVGLAADLAASRALGLHAAPVCTALVAAGPGRVTDVLEVPSDSIAAQLEHVLATTTIAGARVGALGSARAAEDTFRALEAMPGPIVLDFVASGSFGETLLDNRGIDALISLVGRADLVLFSRRDAELVSGGAIGSLDDAQVAVQRLHHRGAGRVVIRCGRLPARFFGAAEDPGGDGSAGALESDLYYDGESFALFEAPHVDGGATDGAAGAFSVATVSALMDGADYEDALRSAKTFVTEAIRHGSMRAGRRELDYTWRASNTAA